MSIQPPQYNESNNNLGVVIDNNLYNINSIQSIQTPSTPPPNYERNTRPIIDNPVIILDLNSEKRKTTLYNLSNSLKSITLIFGIYSLFYIFYTNLLLLFISMFILTIPSYFGLKHYIYTGPICLILYLILDIIIKIIVINNENNLFYNILLPICIVINFYILYLTCKWCKLRTNLNEEELLEMKSGYIPENRFIVWY